MWKPYGIMCQKCSYECKKSLKEHISRLLIKRYAHDHATYAIMHLE